MSTTDLRDHRSVAPGSAVRLTPATSSVLWNLRPSPTGRQLVMFPYLGGFGASFNGLVGHLSGDWDVWAVNPPGHGPSNLKAHRRLGPLVDCYLDALREMLLPGAVFFGHSMGGIVAYHVLLAMAERPEFQDRRPGDLVLSASCAPCDLSIAGHAASSEQDLLHHLCGFGAIPAEVAGDPALVAYFLPAFRADYQVLEEAKWRPVVSLDVSTRLVLGEHDEHTPTGTASAWQDYLTRPIRTHVLDGEGHMFVRHAFEPLDAIVNDV